MFVNAIERVTKFTRPILTIDRLYGSNEVIPSCSTFIIVNDEGWILTCKHVAEGILNTDSINQGYNDFKKEVETIPNKNKQHRNKVHEIEKKYGLAKWEVILVQRKNQFVGVVDSMTGLEVKQHSVYDLALIKINGFSRMMCTEFPVFTKDSTFLKQGKFLCRLGYPFAEFTNYRYDEKTDDIIWTEEGRSTTPLFPIEGMLTRHVAGPDGIIIELELSTPGLQGQSGGPLFDASGIICGMQSLTHTQPLGFDQENREILVKGVAKKVNDYSFIHLGRCIHVDVIKDFMDANGVKYQVG